MDGWTNERNRRERAMGSGGTGEWGMGQPGNQGTGTPGNGEWKVYIVEG